MEAPKLPPFAGEIVNFDRRGARVVACVDASKVQMPPRPGPDGKPVAAPPAPPPGPPRLRIWVLEREVMQELMTTGGLCDPSWSPDGKTFAAAGVRGVFTFTEPNFEPRVLVAGQLQAPAPGAPAAREYDDPAWSPGGGRIAFRSSAGGVSRVEVVDVKSAEVLAEARRSGEGAALGGRADARSSTRRACPCRDRRPAASERPMTERPGRRGYLDWMRGLAVVVMVFWHTLDAWTTPVDKASGAFWYCQLIGGFGAPIFLFLAGVSVALAAGSRLRKAFRASPGPGPGAAPADAGPPPGLLPASSRPLPGLNPASAGPPPGLSPASAEPPAPGGARPGPRRGRW